MVLMDKRSKDPLWLNVLYIQNFRKVKSKYELLRFKFHSICCNTLELFKRA
jgi:hypothetical protein